MNARSNAIIVKDQLKKALRICQDFVKDIKNLAIAGEIGSWIYNTWVINDPCWIK